MAEPTLQVTEIYKSIQGESRFAGLPCALIRLAGCPLRCAWCDTAYAFEKGEAMKIGEIVEKTKSLGVRLAEVTGGEPLAQEQTPALLRRLIDEGFQTLIETSGALPIRGLPGETAVILDVKCPGSGESERNLEENYGLLKKADELKFVLASRPDFDWAVEFLRGRPELAGAHAAFTPAAGRLEPSLLADWMLQTDTGARLRLQLHKQIWPDRERGI